ncbi:MAG: hypothetical protein AMJ62_01035 [Myxococcales bacterium SG8_38]|nr:MAG: hypothetical protein AMJ62_01035 [Myxococcales bacterium SG8_38]
MLSPHLSKSRFLAGLQCHRQLYWRVHEPGAAEQMPNAKLQAILDMGKRVGARARAELPGGVLIPRDPRNIAVAIEATKQALAVGAPIIFEASFLEDGVFVAVDILSKLGDGYVLIEVKATAGPKAHHIPDAAIQAHVVERSGLPVMRIEVMHLNTNHRHPDDDPLFARADITDAVAALRPRIAAEIDAQRKMLQGPLPDVEPGGHCSSPHPCPFLDRCHVPLPDHSIEDLNGLRQRLRNALRDAGIETVDQIPSDFPLKPLHARHRRAVQSNELVVEEGLREALTRYAFPIAMLDFETVAPALPVWNGCSPFGPVPAQFSVHILREDGTMTHRGYLAEEGTDPRPQIAAALADALREAATILAWNAPVEKRCLETLAQACPEHAPALREARDKVHDLLPVVRNHLYHPDFRGRFSIKAVAAALFPHMSYDALEVADGQTASSQLERLLCRPKELSADQRGGLRRELEAYCKRDTEVMVGLFRLLVNAGGRSCQEDPSYTK